MDSDLVLQLFRKINQHQDSGGRSPHKPLLVLMALAQLRNEGSSKLVFSDVETKLRELIEDYRPPRQSRAQPANPFTRLESTIWTLSEPVANDSARELRDRHVYGMFTPEVEAALKEDDKLAQAVARMLVDREFADTQMQEVLIATGLGDISIIAEDPADLPTDKKRSSKWPGLVLDAWNRTCAFCGYSGLLGHAPVGLEAAHLRWFKKGGPDELDNGLALCSLDHKLLDSGALGLTQDFRIRVSQGFVGIASAGQRVLDLHGKPLPVPRPGTPLPNLDHVEWHDQEVFRGPALTA